MTDNTELQMAAEYAAQDTIKFADESEEMRALQQFHEEVDPETVLALIAENNHLAMCARQWEEAARQWGAERDQLKSEVEALRKDKSEPCDGCFMADAEALRKDAERWRFFSAVANDLQAFPHSWGLMNPEKMNHMCDEAIAAAMSKEAGHE